MRFEFEYELTNKMHVLVQAFVDMQNGVIYAQDYTVYDASKPDPNDSPEISLDLLSKKDKEDIEDTISEYAHHYANYQD